MPKIVSEAQEPIQGLCVGRKKGFRVHKFTPKKARPSRSSYVSKHNKFVREIVREVVGYSPYERRAMELIKAGKDKRTVKFLKKRLGGHVRAKKKRDELHTLIQQRKAAH
ncbi:hypothetical protein GJ496_005871 [Pomphorhynchus laevis]|nr:hypothetical protein GJ496_005871 [Pomphorhynchus laevis]